MTSRPNDFPDTVSVGVVPLVESTRGPVVESVHYGSFAVVSADGSVLAGAGEIDTPAYIRSALKPLQSIAMLRAGLELPDELLALSAASHSGAPMHQQGAERILALQQIPAGDPWGTPDPNLGPSTSNMIF